MKLSNRQKGALEKVTGEHWNHWCAEAVNAYFLFTDKGQSPVVLEKARGDFEELMLRHHWHSITVELWKEDFKAGLLSLDDFLNDNPPKAYLRHVLELYKGTMGIIPSKYKKQIEYVFK